SVATLDEQPLREHLRASLPAYMLPQHFVQLPQLPLLPNGKINRKELPPPGNTPLVASVARQAPQTPLERQVLDAMEQVLSLPGLDMRDDFFALGGHSLLAAQLAARICRTLDMQLPLRAIFEAPTAAQLAAWIDARLRSPRSRQWQIRPRSDGSMAPLSLMQQRLWFLEQMDPGRPTYNTPSAHRLRGRLDEIAFNRAFADMIRAQESLRTVIGVVDEQPVQIILPELEYDLLPVADLRTLPSEQREDALLGMIKELAAQPLELTQAPLFCARLFRSGDDEYVFYFSPHHIIWDGWSFDILYREMSSRYDAYRTGGACPLAALPVSYGDFAAWQREWMQGAELAAQLAHWKKHLAGTLEPLAVPCDAPRPATLSGRGATKWIQLAPELAEAAREVARSADATLFMAMLAVYALSLNKYTGQTEVVVGVPVRGRPVAALENVMGMFVNALPLKITIDPGASFMQLLRDVREQVVDAFKYPDVPFEHLVRELRVPRDRSRSPVYQALFSFQDARGRSRSWGNLDHEMIHVLQPSIAEDLALWLMDRPDGLAGGFSYNTDIISEESAELLRRRYEHLLAAVLARPDLPLHALPIPPSEQQQLAAWNATGRAYDRQACIQDLIECQAAAAPGRTAASDAEQSLTYAQLDARANRLAHALRARAIGRGSLVGLCVERGCDMLVAQLAILKSGAAYVPLDPSYPAERLQFMADDAALALLVTQSGRAGVVPFPRERTLLLDGDAALLAAQPATAVPDDTYGARPEDAAYVIYTSGSTGQPKGVQVPHRAVVNFLSSMRQEPGIGAQDKLVAVTTLSFDIAVLELLLPLTVGAEVVLAGQDEARDPHALAALLTRSRASLMQATPGTWRMLLDAGWQAPPGFKALIGGEALSAELAARLLPAVSELWNMYGPTETTVWSTCWRVTDAQAIRIGRPIANTSVWVLDEQRRPCPIGTPGEIWIGGDGVTLGYLNRAQLNAERYIDDPFSGTPGARLYRTGDRGRWCADGLLE
ncbi:MAG TPA: amino acid adenylation domain-containing protein, partial [Noviherbaspirillum sp.]|nr:amino acid adenylation domain-containing protein [Noviherbaspirillum sp.]